MEKTLEFITTRKMRDTSDCVIDYVVEDSHTSYELARNCIKEYNACFELMPWEIPKPLQIVMTKYGLKDSVYNSGIMLDEIKKKTMKTVVLKVK